MLRASPCATIRHVHVPDVQIVWVFRVQDTPGYGDDQDISKHIHMIVDHINAQNTKWLEMENAKDRWAGRHMRHASKVKGCGDYSVQGPGKNLDGGSGHPELCAP